MKRIFLLCLSVLLLLCGCQVRQEITVPTTAPAVTVPAAPTEPAGIYDSASALEAATGGAIKVYPLGLNNSLGIASMGKDLLLFSGDENTTLTKFCGDNLQISAQTTIDFSIFPDGAAVQVSEAGVTYYDEGKNALIVLNAQLEAVETIPLPDSICGAPALSSDRKSLYYCTQDALRCIDLENGLDRLVKELYFSSINLTALHCDDTVISCATEDNDGNFSQLYISTKNGELLWEIFDATAVWTHGATYLATHADGVYTELLTGDSEQGPTLLSPSTYNSHVHPVLNWGGTVLTTDIESGNCITLDYYNLQRGTRTATLTLPGREMPYHFIANADAIWFVRYDASYGCEILCRWDVAQSATGETISRFTPRYSADNPDEKGLSACYQMARELSEKYGVEILLWTDAVAFQPWDYTLVPEYQVRVIQEELIELDSILALYPEGLLQKAAEGTTRGRIQVCLVRSILGNKGASGTLSEVVGLQYWNDERGVYDAYLALSVEQEGLMRNTCHEIFHILESRVMTECKAYDDWDKLNPAGFEYDYDYVANLNRTDFQWVQGEKKAFIDNYSMSYPKEDRARIMEYAMEAGNESLFQTATMQQKLRQLSLGIREAFGMKKTNEPFIWEQYLNEPLHYG